MQLHGPSAWPPTTLIPQRTRLTHRRGEDEHATTRSVRPQVPRLLLCRAGARPGLRIDRKRRLGKEPLVGDHGHFGHQGPPRIGERLARCAIPIRGVGNGFVDPCLGRRLGGLHYCQRLGAIGRIARQDAHCCHQLGVGVSHHLGFVPIKAVAAALAPVPHLRIVLRHQPVLGHALLELRSSLRPFDVLQQDPAQQPGRFAQGLLLGTACRQPAQRLADQFQHAVRIRDHLSEELTTGGRGGPVDVGLPLETGRRHVAPIAGRLGPLAQFLPGLPRQTRATSTMPSASKL
jgi:hypothetical protein